MSEYWLLRTVEGAADTVTWGLPQSWRDREGRWIDGLASLAPEELLPLGWERMAAATLSPADQAVAEPLVRASLNARLAEHRYNHEVGGIVFSGIAILTNRESQSLIDSMHGLLRDEVMGSVKFKSADGVVVICDLSMATALRTAVGLFVQAARNAEADHSAEIAAIGADAVTLAAYDFTTGWPSRVVG